MTTTGDAPAGASTLTELFRRSVARHADRPAVSDDRRTLTYAALDHEFDAALYVSRNGREPDAAARKAVRAALARLSPEECAQFEAEFVQATARAGAEEPAPTTPRPTAPGTAPSAPPTTVGCAGGAGRGRAAPRQPRRPASLGSRSRV